ncbi:MAG: hypothetical protein O7B35_12635 [Deltaproteobacteria bacterium]|nr:hypothetical protein [Deltaproteobacteria bacterium]
MKTTIVLTMAEAAMVLGVSERHSFRIKARIGKERVQGGARDRTAAYRPVREDASPKRQRSKRPLSRDQGGNHCLAYQSVDW